MVIDERSTFQLPARPSSTDKSTVTSVYNGRYVVRTYNTLLGLQTGGKLEYRFCRWSFDGHANVGAYLNLADQESRIQTNIDGATTDNPFSDSAAVAAFAGGFGVTGSYKLRPNLTARMSYDLLWVGDLAPSPGPDDFQLYRHYVAANFNQRQRIL